MISNKLTQTKIHGKNEPIFYIKEEIYVQKYQYKRIVLKIDSIYKPKPSLNKLIILTQPEFYQNNFHE